VTDSKIVIVTGACRGIGAGCARHLAAVGWRPVVFARSAAVEDVARETGGLAVRGSITDPDDLARLVAQTVETFGRIDGVAISTGDPPTGLPVVTITDDAWREAFDLLFLDVVRLARLVTPVMARQGGGAMVAIAAADLTEPGEFSPFSILRWPMAGFVKLYARQHAATGIRINTLSPSFAWDDDSEAGDYPTDAYGPMARAARYEEVARAAAFLLSDDASYVTGTDLRVDGAWSQRLQPTGRLVNGGTARHGGRRRPPPDRSMPVCRPVLHVVGLLLCGLAATMLVPAAVDLDAGNPDWQIFAASALVTVFVGGSLAISCRGGGTARMGRREAYLLTGLSWIAVSAFAATPFLGLGLDYTDALFEAVSGVTTTGSTVLTGLDRLQPGILVWRSLLQWIGGVGIIVMAILVLPFLRVGGMQLFHTESADRSEKVVPSAQRFAALIALVYCVLTAACFMAYVAAGMTGFDAVNHAMTTVATGGYATRDASLGAFGPGVQWVAIVFMIAGALPFVVYIRAVTGRQRAVVHDPQVRGFFAVLAVWSLALAAWVVVRGDMAPADALRHATFSVVSIVTTTGFATLDYQAWGPGVVAAAFVLTFVGACAGSTSGGIKIYRHQILMTVVRGQLSRAVSPNRVAPLRYGGASLPPDVPAAVLAFLAVYLGTVGLFAVALAFMGLDLVTALSAAATAISNVGPGLGPLIGPAGTFQTLPDTAKALLVVAMLLGRLEIFTLLVLLDPKFWRS